MEMVRTRNIEVKCHAHNKDGSPCKNPAVTDWGVCRMHGANGGRPPSTGRYSRKVSESLSAKVDELLQNGDPLDVMRPVATSAVALQSYVDHFEPGVTLDAKAISNISEWAESLVRSITRIVDARAKMALTAAEVQLIVARMADIANEFVPIEKHQQYFDKLNSLFGGSK